MSLTVTSLKLHFWKSLISCGCSYRLVVCDITITLLVSVFVRRRVRLSDTPLTITTFHLTPGMSPIAPPLVPPIPSTTTSSCSSTTFKCAVSG